MTEIDIHRRDVAGIGVFVAPSQMKSSLSQRPMAGSYQRALLYWRPAIGSP